MKQERIFKFIQNQLYFEGKIQRKDIANKFNISDTTAYRHLKNFHEIHQDLIERNGKVWEAKNNSFDSENNKFNIINSLLNYNLLTDQGYELLDEEDIPMDVDIIQEKNILNNESITQKNIQYIIQAKSEKKWTEMKFIDLENHSISTKNIHVIKLITHNNTFYIQFLNLDNENIEVQKISEIIDIQIKKKTLQKHLKKIPLLLNRLPLNSDGKYNGKVILLSTLPFSKPEIEEHLINIFQLHKENLNRKMHFPFELGFTQFSNTNILQGNELNSWMKNIQKYISFPNKNKETFYSFFPNKYLVEEKTKIKIFNYITNEFKKNLKAYLDLSDQEIRAILSSIKKSMQKNELKEAERIIFNYILLS